ncbi:MAG TPA: hypothetical protein VGQ51_15300 [Puia sp.]|nr:hypothetical protein [Puia sp.]
MGTPITNLLLSIMLSVVALSPADRLQAQTPARYKSYEGEYRSRDDSDDMVRLIAADTGIVMKQLWDRKELRFYSVTDTYFYNAELRYALYILKDESGKAKSILLGRARFEKVGP